MNVADCVPLHKKESCVPTRNGRSKRFSYYWYFTAPGVWGGDLLFIQSLGPDREAPEPFRECSSYAKNVHGGVTDGP